MNAALPQEHLGSPERFGYAWARFNDLTPEQEEQFQRWTVHLDPQNDWKGKRFLDAGCGAGRNSFWAMTYGAAGGVAVDLDEGSLAAAVRNLAQFPSVSIECRSLYDLGYENEFDIVFSIGVVHHLIDPALAIRRLVAATKPGGKVLIWVYGYENMEFFVNVLNPVRKALFSRLPVGLVRVFAYIPSTILWFLLRCGFSPMEYFRLLRRFPFRHLHAIVFDQMLPRTATYWTRQEAYDKLADAGLEDIRLHWVNEISWSVMGSKSR